MRRPLLWYVLAWIGGSAVAGAWPVWTSFSLWLGLGALFAAVVIWLCKLPCGHLIIVVLLAAAAYGYGEWRDSRNVTALTVVSSDLDLLSGSEVTAVGRVAAPVDVDGDRASFVFEAEELLFDGSAAPIRLQERLRINVRLLEQQEQQTAQRFERTDRVKVNGVLLRPEPSRNFGGFDYRDYLRRQHIHWLLSVKGMTHVQRLDSGADRMTMQSLLLWNDRLRTVLAAKMDHIFPADQSGLMKSMLIGWQDDMDPEQYRQFSKLGLTHILAISGMNVAVFLGLLFAVLKRLRLTRETILLIGISVMPAYVLLTGSSPSIVRAGLMSMLALYAARRGWLKDGLHVMAVAAWAMLIWEPYYLYDVGCQLTFMITAALISGVPRTARLLPIGNERIRQAVVITLVSQFVSFPISVYYFNVFSLLSWLANALFVPVFGAVLFPAALASLIVGLVWLPLGHVAGTLTGMISRWTLWAIDRMSSWDGLQLVWPTPSPLWIAAYFILLGLLLLGLTRKLAPRDDDSPGLDSSRSSWRPVAACSAALVLLLFYGYTPDRFSRTARIEFLDVGQGDAALIRTPARKFILIDGGGTLSFLRPGEQWKERRNPFEVGRSVVVPLLLQRGVHQLDMVISTHQDQDHIGGLQAVAEQFPIGQFMFNGTLKTDPRVKQLFRTLLDKGVPLVPAQRGAELQLDTETTMTVLAPGTENTDRIRIADKQNNESIVFLLNLYGRRFLFTGDMETPEEEDILAEHPSFPPPSPNPPLDVMKIAHHGSKSSSSPAWLERWHPQLTIISVGARNVYGHPSPIVLKRLQTAGIRSLRTDQDGAVHFIIDPHNFRVETKLTYK